MEWVKAGCGWVLEIIKRTDDVTGFQLLPRRWVVERTFAWLGKYRRLSKDNEHLPGEQRIGRLRRERSESFYVATKAGRRLQPHAADGYNKENLTCFVERSLCNLGVESLDLLQLHCPPTEVYYRRW